MTSLSLPALTSAFQTAWSTAASSTSRVSEASSIGGPTLTLPRHVPRDAGAARRRRRSGGDGAPPPRAPVPAGLRRAARLGVARAGGRLDAPVLAHARRGDRAER